MVKTLNRLELVYDGVTRCGYIYPNYLEDQNYYLLIEKNANQLSNILDILEERQIEFIIKKGCQTWIINY